MEQKDIAVLEKNLENDVELQTLWEEHQFFEKQLEKFESKPFLTPQEEGVVKEIKKKKLAGKTKLQGLLDKYRETED